MVAAVADLATIINQTNLVVLMVIPLVEVVDGDWVLAVQVEHMEIMVVMAIVMVVVLLMLVEVAVLVVLVKQCLHLLPTLDQQQVDLEHQQDLDIMQI